MDNQWLISYNDKVDQAPQNNSSNQTYNDPRLEQLQKELKNLEKLLLITKNKFFSQQQKYNQVVNEMNQERITMSYSLSNLFFTKQYTSKYLLK